MKEVHGINMHTLAELEARSNALRAEHGEGNGQAAFSQFLTQRGLSDLKYSEAWQQWHEHFRQDLSRDAQVYFIMQQQYWADADDASEALPAGLSEDRCLQGLKSDEQDERWRDALYLGRLAEMNQVTDKARTIAVIAPILEEILDRHETATVGEATRAIQCLGALNVRTDDVKSALQRCWARSHGVMTSYCNSLAVCQFDSDRIRIEETLVSYAKLRNALQAYMDMDGPAQQEEAPIVKPGAVTTPSKSGFPKALVIAPVLLALIGGGVLYTRHEASAPEVAPSPVTIPSAVSTPIPAVQASTSASVRSTGTLRPTSPATKIHKKK